MDTVIFFQRMDTDAARHRMEGLSAFAREAGWFVQNYSEPFTKSSLADIIDFWHPLGIVLGTNDHHTEYDARLCDVRNTVLLDCFPGVGVGVFTAVASGSSKVPELAMRELLQAKCASYGFVPWSRPRAWSDWRREHFLRIAAANGEDARVFQQSDRWSNVRELQQELVEWLRTLPKPTGIFAANDIVGMNVMNACRLAGIAVPFECIVVGVGNDELICDGTAPSLTSVGLDFKAAGYRAGECLKRMLDGECDSHPIETMEPLGLVRRGSTRTFRHTDRHALAATELIRAKACSGLKARDALAVYPCSRRLAEKRFRQATGRSALEEIVAARIERAKTLLADRRRELSSIAGMCGYESDTTFRRVFRQATGMTLAGWRKAAEAGRRGAVT